MPTFANNPTAEFESVTKSILKRNGYDPEKYNIDLDTFTPVERTSGMGAFLGSAAYSIPEAVTGLAGMAVGAPVGTAAGAGLAPFTGPAAPFMPLVGGALGTAVGGIGAPMLAEPYLSKLKQQYLPQKWNEYIAQSQAEHPYASTAGSIASGLVGFKPNLSNIPTAARGARSLISGVPFSRLSAAQRSAVPNVAAGAALGTGIPLAEQVAASDKPTFMEKLGDVDPYKVGMGTLGGTLMTQPNRIGRAIGFHPTPEIDTGGIVPPVGGRAPALGQNMSAPWKRLNDKLATSQGADITYPKEPLVDENAAPVEGTYDPSNDPLKRALIQINEQIGQHDVQPHELIHNLVNQIMTEGNPAEQAFLQRALQAFGGSDEKLVQAAGELFSGRFKGKPESMMGDLASFFRDRFLNRGTPKDYANIMANILQRQGGMRERPGATLPTKPADKPTGVSEPPVIPTGKTPAETRRIQINARLSELATKGQKGTITAEERNEIKALLDEYSGTLPKVAEPPDTRKPFDTGEQTYPETEFEGWKPTPPPERPLKQPVEDAPWETEGGNYPQDEPAGPLSPETQRRIDFEKARAEQVSQQYEEPAPTKPEPQIPADLNPQLAEALRTALQQRQIEGSIEQPRGKVTEQTKREDYPTEYPHPFAEPRPKPETRTEAERIQDEMEGTGRKYKKPDADESTEGGANVDRLIELLRSRQDLGDVTKTTGRELLQNAADQLWSYHANPDDRTIYTGRADKDPDSGLPSIFMMDTGGGMSPNFLASKYLSMGTTGKKIGEGGGLGIAKGQMFGNADKFDIISVWKDPNGVIFKSTLEGTDKSFMRAQKPFKIPKLNPRGVPYELVPGLSLKVEQLPPDAPTGTFVRLHYKAGTSTYPAGSAIEKGFEYITDIKQGDIYEDSSKSGASGDPRLPDSMRYPYHAKPEFTQKKFTTLHHEETPNASIDIQAPLGGDVRPRHMVNYEYLSNGLWQFDGSSPWLDDPIELPGGIVINVKSKVPGEARGYPFSIDRKSTTSEVTDVVGKFVQKFIADARIKMLAKYKDALTKAPRFTNHPDKVALDVADKVPPDYMDQIVNDPNMTPVINALSIVQDAIKNTLGKLYPTKNFTNYDFNGVLTGSADAYGVRFGSANPGSRGQIYIDPFLLFELATKESIQNSDTTKLETMTRWLGKLTGTATHENLHQEIHSEGEELSRELSVRLGDIVLDSRAIGRLLDTFIQNPDLVATLHDTLEKHNTALQAYRDTSAGKKFISGTEASTRSQPFSTRKYARQGRFGPTEEQTGEVPKRIGWNILAGEATKLERGGPDHAELAGVIRSLYNRRRELRGKYGNPIIDAFDQLGNDARNRVYETLIDEDKTKQSQRGNLQSPQEEAAYDQIRQTIAEMAQDQIAAGQPVFLPNGLSRQRGQDPFYFPNIMDRGVHRVLTEGQNTQAFQDLRQDFIDHQLSQGITQAEAESRFSDIQGTFAKSTAGNPFDFQAVRQMEGVGLPDSWIERDPVKASRTYTSRFARDRASWDTLESNPRAMRMLGSRMYRGNQPIPATVQAPNLVKDTHVQRLVKDFMGATHEDEPGIRGGARLVHAAIVGPLSKVADIMTSPFKAVGYTAPWHEMDVLKGLMNLGEGYRNSFKTGLNRKGGLVIAQDILGYGEHLNTKMVRLAEFMTKYSGAEKMELISRGISQALGEAIGGTHQRLMARGDAKSTEFLQKIGVDDQTPLPEVGTRIAQLLQGHYDATNLPHAVQHGSWSPFFGLLRWSVEQTNNFERFAVAPALKGDFRPAVVTLLSGLLGGLFINELREKILGKSQYTANWKELEAGKGKPGYGDALTYKLMSAANVSGTAGILSELAKQTYESATGRTIQGFRYPLGSMLLDTKDRVFAAAKAIREGEDTGDVLKQLTKDLLNNNIQVYRLIRQNLGRTGFDEESANATEKANQKRDLNVWERMEGKSQSIPSRTPPNYNMGERKFNDASLMDSAKMVPSLVNRAMQRSHGDISELSKRFGALGNIKPYGMPSNENNPVDFIRYYNWVKQTQGPETANRLMQEFIKRQAESGAKSSMVPSINIR
jgi:hypothetical protein